jgi:hypothetical protein
MIKRNQDKIFINNKIIYKVETDTGWSIVIMPDAILIDNYHHGYVHIHPDPMNHNNKIEIKDFNQDDIHFIVYNHIFQNKKLIIKKLISELK